MGLLEDYRYYLKIERGLSSNTVASYCSDLEEFLSEVKTPVQEISTDEIISFLGSRKISKRSQARLLSSLRSFFSYLVIEREREDNPCDGIDSPKLGRYLPSVLSLEEVEAIMDSVSLDTWQGVRDRAILEVLYGCGLRVSEAVDLAISRLYLDEGFVRVIGKGDKERLVPMGEVAVSCVRDYLSQRPEPKAGYDDILFLNRFGKALSRVSIFNMVKEDAAVRVRHEPQGGSHRHQA